MVKIKERIENNLSRSFGISPKEADINQIYDATAQAVKNLLLEKRKTFNQMALTQNKKKVYYLCMEFLLGRSLKTSICNLGIEDEVTNVLKTMGYSLEDIYDCEPDAGLGNGGLGRLAACYMDSLASLNYPAMGFSLRYEYGLFKQKIIDGWQTEMPDVWLPGGEVWLSPRPDKNTVVKFGGKIEEFQGEQGRLEFRHVDYSEVEAMAYDLMISGSSEGVSVLRLWRARNIHKFNMNSFSQGDYMRAMEADNEAEMISKVLYPSDNHENGKSLRLKQQYFLVSASVNNIIRDVLRRGGDIKKLSSLCAIHINDTHPALVVPELMRVLLDDFKLNWDEAWNLVVNSVNYTNHTVLAEALECWSVELISGLLPRLWQIICEIDRRHKERLNYLQKPHLSSSTSVIDYGTVKMANLSIIGSTKVNGVSDLHSKILKKDVFKDFASFEEDKFTNVTNGIAMRRWLCFSNKELYSFLKSKIGEDFYNNFEKLEKLLELKDDKEVLKNLEKIKMNNKVAFANYAKKTLGITIDPSTRFDVQSKRLHEYKRQLLNALKIISYYNMLKENPDMPFTPQTFIFAAKAAPSYYFAKEIIKLICLISKEIDKNPKIKAKLNVVFLENYSVTMAEKLMPATEVSEQISTAGKEASGTGNMKFMVNGAITLGTMDGANVEIFENVGKDNIFIFGKSAKEVEEIWKLGYNSIDYYMNNPEIKKIVDTLNGTIGGENFSQIANYLVNNKNGMSDPFMCLLDFDDYMQKAKALDEAYKNKDKWNKMSLVNIAKAGHFSADRAIEEYAKDIWHLEKVKF